MRKRWAEKGKYACAGKAQSLSEVYVTLPCINGNCNSSTVVKFSNISSYENVCSNWKCVRMILSQGEQLYLSLEVRWSVLEQRTLYTCYEHWVMLYSSGMWNIWGRFQLRHSVGALWPVVFILQRCIIWRRYVLLCSFLSWLLSRSESAFTN